MAEFNTNEIERLGYRLEEQASTFQVTTDNIEYDFKRISTILKLYNYSDVIDNLLRKSEQYAEGWSNVRNNLKNGILLIAARMTGYTQATKSNVELSSSELESIKAHFDQYYSSQSYNDLFTK